MVKRRVFVSVARRLDPRRAAVKASIIAKIEDAGYEPQEFWQSGLAANMAWNFANVDRVMRRCVGAVVIGFPRWTIPDAKSGPLGFIGEYNHYEGAVANCLGLPLLLLAEQGVANQGIVWTGGGKTISYIPQDADESFVDQEEFGRRFAAWRDEVNNRKDVFLGYCSQNSGTAALIQTRLQAAGCSVLNYQMDFRAGSSILGEIEEAAALCSSAVFLFAENDPMDASVGEAAPRDNVVFESGYFMSLKGPDRCLIVRQGSAKMPADLGGAIYLQLEDGNDVAPIEARLERFVTKNL